ncbi:MAG: hypothetical protein AAB381_01350 [Patescibacteria group bacterium]
MLSLFPSLLSWGQLSPFILRIILGCVFLYWAYTAIRSKNISTIEYVFGYIEGVAGLLLIAGLWVQGAALVACIKLVGCIIGKIRTGAFLTDGVNYYLILLAIAVSLLLTGAGFFAFDLPL